MERIELTVPEASHGFRLDRFLAAARPEISRTEIQRQIRGERVRVSGVHVLQSSYRVRLGEEIVWEIPSRKTLTPRRIPLAIISEDAHIVVVDKPTGLVVHPGAGTEATTLVEALLADRILPESDDPSRPGIVHRLDKDTSGVLVVAKTPQALSSLQAQFAARTVTKFYIALVKGWIEENEGWIDAPVGRDPARPSRMGVQPDGKPAQTAFRVLSRHSNDTLLLARPRTGRTHQIRVHLSYIEHPVLGDQVYGSSDGTDRLLLHAWRLGVNHPDTGVRVRYEAAVPEAFPSYPYDDIPWDAVL